MASRPGAKDTILPSVLDRLLDDEPDQRQERPKPAWGVSGLEGMWWLTTSRYGWSWAARLM